MICSICRREGEEEYFEKHHLVPQNKNSETINVCHQCGDQIHLLFDNGYLKNNLSNLEDIINNERMKKYISWIGKRPIERKFSVAKKKRRK